LPFNVRSVNSDFSEALRWHLEPFLRPRLEQGYVPVRMYVREQDEGKDPPPFSLSRTGEQIHTSPYLAAMLTFALWDLHAYVSKEVRDFLLLHSGSVTAPDGALLLPAEPEVGKSSTVTALLQKGFGYLSDELGVIDPVSGQAYPFEKRITLQPASLRFFPGLEESVARHPLTSALQDRFFAPGELGASVARPSPVRALVFLSEDRQGPPKLTAIPRAEAVERMARNAFNLDVYGERGVILLGRVAGQAETFRIEGGTAPERAQLLAERFGA
jgi:hypothetical protein